MERRNLTLQVAPRTTLLLTADRYRINASVFIEPGRDQIRPVMAAHAGAERAECTRDNVRIDTDVLWITGTAFAIPADAADQVAGFLADACIPYTARPAQVAA